MQRKLFAEIHSVFSQNRNNKKARQSGQIWLPLCRWVLAQMGKRKTKNYLLKRYGKFQTGFKVFAKTTEKIATTDGPGPSVKINRVHQSQFLKVRNID